MSLKETPRFVYDAALNHFASTPIGCISSALAERALMAAKLGWLLVRAHRLGTFVLRSCRRKTTVASLAIGLAAVGGCRNDISRKNIESDRFLDQYAAGRGLTRDQARDEVAAKMKEKETEQAMDNVENVGLKVR